jgi:hypothetical protein
LKHGDARLARMLFAAKCYWPGVTKPELELLMGRATGAGVCPDRSDVAYLGSLLFAADALVLCLFDGATPTAVKHEAEMAGLPWERLMECVWLGPSRCQPRL